MPPSKNDELKQLVAEVRYLREELANVKADMVIVKNIVEKTEHQSFFGTGTGTGLGFDARAPVTRGGAYGEVSRTDSKRRYTLDDTDLARLGRAFVTRYIKTYSVTATYYRAIDVFWLACAKYGGPRGIVNRRKKNRRKTRT